MRIIVLILLLTLPAQIMAEAAATPVKLMTIAPQETPIVRTFYGRVTARSTVELAFQAGGLLADLPATEGTLVPAGEVLARLDLEPFERELDRSRAQYELARSDLARQEKLGPTIIPQAQIDVARTDAELARVAVAAAEAALEDATLIAPFDSLIAHREAERYATVSAGQTIVRIHDMSELRVTIEVPELVMRQTGANPQVAAEALLGGAADPVPLVFRELTAEASEVGQTFRLTLAFDGEVPARLLPGASVSVRLTLARAGADARTLVPATAVRFAADGTPQVLVLEAGNVLTAHPVRIAPGPDGQFVLLDGPEPGSEIVATGAWRLSDGDAVRRYEGLLDAEGGK
ncbi:efflux RND transporter periplasmic adaptor subunit [Pseudoruegeria sp. HB172150]|uniref:efflux RND transporter periplasmic adaptor subunit n=1 Tax=Pseudoruegeria sp. HB172150 TaxID=2721164 RepID=UPI001C12FDA9|nr:efflux RND transporter periplasmic adaptor subunit [Pseudoruegeria sp. HB172150]